MAEILTIIGLLVGVFIILPIVGSWRQNRRNRRRQMNQRYDHPKLEKGARTVYQEQYLPRETEH